MFLCFLMEIQQGIHLTDIPGISYLRGMYKKRKRSYALTVFDLTPAKSISISLIQTEAFCIHQRSVQRYSRSPRAKLAQSPWIPITHARKYNTDFSGIVKPFLP